MKRCKEGVKERLEVAYAFYKTNGPDRFQARYREHLLKEHNITISVAQAHVDKKHCRKRMIEEFGTEEFVVDYLTSLILDASRFSKKSPNAAIAAKKLIAELFDMGERVAAMLARPVDTVPIDKALYLEFIKWRSEVHYGGEEERRSGSE